MIHTRLRKALVAMVAVALLAPLAAAQSVAGVPPSQRAEFNTLVKQRNSLAIQLRRLDDQASDLIKQDEDATVVHAQQVSTQDQLDLVELRLAILATRHGVAVPEVPAAAAERESATGGPTDGRIERAFARGRSRAVARLQEDTRRFLASLSFKRFLAE